MIQFSATRQKILLVSAGLLLVIAVAVVAIRRNAGDDHGSAERSPESRSSRNGGHEASPGPSSAEIARRRVSQKYVEIDQIPGPLALAHLRNARTTANTPNFPLFGKDGILTRQAIAEYSLDDDQALQVQEATTSLMAGLKKLAASNIVVDTLRSDPESGIRALVAQPFDASKHFENYSEMLANTFGNQRAGELLLSFPLEQYYGEMGKNEVGFKIYEGDPDHAGEGVRIEFQERDPETARTVRRGTSHSLTFDRFPGVFDVSMNLHQN